MKDVEADRGRMNINDEASIGINDRCEDVTAGCSAELKKAIERFFEGLTAPVEMDQS